MKADFRLDLAPLDSTDMEQIRAWRNDYRIWRWTRQSDFISDIDQAGWFERQAKDPAIRMYRLVAAVNEVRETVGVCGLTSIDWMNRRAEFSLYIRPDRQRRGLGAAGLRLLLSHGFGNLNLRQIWGETMAGNPAIAVFLAAGMKMDGKRREFYFKDGAYHDAFLVSILREEWLGNAGSDDSGDPRGPDPEQSRGGLARGPGDDGGEPHSGASGVEAPPGEAEPLPLERPKKAARRRK